MRDPINAWIARRSLIPNTPIIDASEVPGLAALGENWRAIREELCPLLADTTSIPAFGKISPDHRRIAPSDHWKSFFFVGYGFRPERNRRLCPKTAALLDQVPNLVVAFFSIMEPGTHVPRHRGLTKAWLNCHLPLVVPSHGRCEMQVADETVSWKEGEWLVFDETNPHEVWNDTDEARIVLFLQVRRPMTTLGNAAAKLIHGLIRRSSFVQDAKKAIQ